MSQLFEDSDSDVEFKTNKDYAKTYDTWRKKEVLNKLKTKYGEGDEDDSSSSSDDDEIGIELTEEIEEDFYKTLASLKKKDPKIYDENVVFFTESTSENKKESKKSKEDESMYLKDYERKLLLEKGGIVSDDEEADEESKVTYTEEQKKLRESLKKAVEDEESDTEEWGGMFKVRQENKDQENKEEADYKAWLAGQKKNLDKETKASLKPLKDYWNDPNLDDGEKFLKDYILNKRYLAEENADYIPTYDEIVHDSDENLSEDENAIEKQEEFEHKYNFRFEEPDQEFIKRFPRTMEHSLRKEDDRRKLKRVETKERKAREKVQKMEDLQKLRELKRKEIEEKIEKLKEITGNKEMAFKDADLDDDFDPEEHDKRMQALFDDEYYEGPEEDQKPKFDIDDDDAFLEELETENFDNWTGKNANEEKEPHCEDDDFNMDADYDPLATQKELIENSKRKKKRKRKSKFVEMLGEDRPNFDPTDRTYEEYIDEYYKLDCEDIIDNIPCRFKYRKVPPNSFGLTVEEILLAKDRELNKWCSLKKAVQIRPEHIEKYDQVAYEKKGANIALKKRMLPSLFNDEEEVDENSKNENEKTKIDEGIKTVNNKEKGKRNMKNKNEETGIVEGTSGTDSKKNMKHDGAEKSDETNKKKRKRNNTEVNGAAVPGKKEDNKNVNAENPPDEVNFSKNVGTEIDEGKSDNTSKKRKRNANTEVSEAAVPGKKKKGKEVNVGIIPHEVNAAKNNIENKESTESNLDKADKKKRKKKKKTKQNKISSVQNQPSKINKKKMEKTGDNQALGFSDARLAAIGLNPKKFKNKVKYRNK